jgi:iron complex outermembrane recepter protein
MRTGMRRGNPVPIRALSLIVPRVWVLCSTVAMSAILAPSLAYAQEVSEVPKVQLDDTRLPQTRDDESEPAQAGDTDAGVSRNAGDVIFVTARRVAENVQDIPAAVTAISGDELHRRGVNNAEDLQTVMPSLVSQRSPTRTSVPIFAIRGQRGTISPLGLADPAVSLIFADAPIMRPFGINDAYYDLASIQVLRGAQGTLFGINSVGGAIIIAPQAPRLGQSEGHITVGAGDFDYRRGEAVVNLPIGDAVAIRAAGQFIRRDGYMTNIVNGQRLNGLHSNSFRLGMKFEIGSIESTTTGTYFDSKHGSSGYRAVSYDPRGNPAAFSPVAAPLINNAVSAALAQVPPGKFDIISDQVGLVDEWAWSIQNTTSIDIGAVTIKNVIAYREFKNFERTDVDGLGIDFGTWVNDSSGRQFSNEIQLLGKAGPVNYVLGLFYGNEQVDEAREPILFGFAASLAPPFLAMFPQVSPQIYVSNNQSIGLFAHTTTDLSSLAEGLTLSAGFRYTWDRRRVELRNVGRRGTPPTFTCTLTGLPATGIGDPTCLLEDEIKFSQPSWNVSLDYQVTPNLLVYAAHRRGYRSGGFNGIPILDSSGLIGLTFNPETVMDYELGFKWDFNVGGSRGRFNLAGYLSRGSDAQRFVAITTTTSVSTIIVNAATTKIYGGEAEFSLDLTDRLRVGGSYALVKPSYSNFRDSYDSDPLTAGVQPASIDISASRFAGVSKHQLSLTARYEVPIPEEMGRPAIQLSYSYLSGFASSENNVGCVVAPPPAPAGALAYKGCLGVQGDVPARSLLNARVDWEDFAGIGVDLALFVNNLTNEYYYASNNTLAIPTGVSAYLVGAPRMWGLELKVPFGAARRSSREAMPPPEPAYTPPPPPPPPPTPPPGERG